MYIYIYIHYIHTSLWNSQAWVMRFHSPFRRSQRSRLGAGGCEGQSRESFGICAWVWKQGAVPYLSWKWMGWFPCAQWIRLFGQETGMICWNKMQISCISAEISGFSGKSRASGFCGCIFQQKPWEETCKKNVMYPTYNYCGILWVFHCISTEAV